ncbi:hypothetical protein EYC98_09100 [Halieaceae bacterium IMCC14734]|uniref:SMP-30/Gluconolactonase/LRE-like region domain-containing protein n=1 Tax=Candidatus Litorirhabdus singularis TaxID=2518993 RepID=A0ABT3TG54_9GAMM|nr:hypothetical protein [Candidatus Litorirhabdus singularis]MCX2981019.1 hypothetical protein [Candidatus Litorirhabdus singularis]
MFRLLALLTTGLLITACGDTSPPIVGCESVGDIRPVCGMQAPEDIAALPDNRHLLLAHFPGMEGGVGSISLFDTNTETLRTLYPTDAPAGSATAPWGQTDCTRPPEIFGPHGTHLHQMADGRWRYLVVNHGEREAIEVFEVIPAGSATSIEWRGCVIAAEETFVNDVVGFNNGDIAFTRMLHNGGNIEMLQSLVGIPTGDVWRWSHDGGLRILPGTDASQPNGLEISADNRFLFANMYMENEVWKINADSGEVIGRAALKAADNSAWGSDGRLLVASHTGSLLTMVGCLDAHAETCPVALEIVALDPQTMATGVVFSHSGAPMGAATVAVPQAGRIYMGSFAGDRLISVPDFAPAR